MSARRGWINGNDQRVVRSRRRSLRTVHIASTTTKHQLISEKRSDLKGNCN